MKRCRLTRERLAQAFADRVGKLFPHGALAHGFEIIECVVECLMTQLTESTPVARVEHRGVPFDALRGTLL